MAGRTARRYERPGALVLKNQRGEIRVDAGAALRTQIRGHLSETLAERLCDAVADSHGAARNLAFHDWEAMSGYDPSARLLLAKMLDESQTRFEMTHILLGSSLAGMGVSIAATLRGQAVRTYTSRDTWKQALVAVEHGER